ncbi:MAG: hypothetical protein CL609_07255 [Anaerolineaceae bacterium]|nr:hypothetical protein [Anaerolineaceae bacterium]
MIRSINYPNTYRKTEIDKIISAVEAGESISLVGLSGAGKSNLLGFLSTQQNPHIKFVYIDGNRLQVSNSQNLLQLILNSIIGENNISHQTEFSSLENEIGKILVEQGKILCLIIDRFDILNDDDIKLCGANLRALRDQFKYQLTYIFGTRKPIPIDNEISELFFGNTIWLEPLNYEDASWSIKHYLNRNKINCEVNVIQQIYDLSRGYPSFMRAICEAYAAGCSLQPNTLQKNPIFERRITEFLRDDPTPEMLKHSGLESYPFFNHENETKDLTEKEYLLLSCLKHEFGKIVEKDKIIKFVWPEDKVFQEGIRDDSLAQLIRRLRRKIENDPGNSLKILTITGRGYKITQK